MTRDEFNKASSDLEQYKAETSRRIAEAKTLDQLDQLKEEVLMYYADVEIKEQREDTYAQLIRQLLEKTKRIFMDDMWDKCRESDEAAEAEKQAQ